MDHNYQIKEDLLVLRPLHKNDIQQLRIWRNDTTNSKYIRNIGQITPTQQEAWFANYLANKTELFFAIDYDGHLIGAVSLYDLDKPKPKFGRLLIGQTQGKGLGRKATIACLKIAFGEIGLHEIYAEVTISNIAAIVIYTKIGFYVTGVRYNQDIQQDEFLITATKERFEALNIK